MIHEKSWPFYEILCGTLAPCIGWKFLTTSDSRRLGLCISESWSLWMQMALPESRESVNRSMEKISCNNTYVGTTRKWELKGHTRSPKYSPLQFCSALEVTSLQFTPTPAIVLPIYSRMTATKPLELVVYSTVDINYWGKYTHNVLRASKHAKVLCQ